jgi:hypothetical protein
MDIPKPKKGRAEFLERAAAMPTARKLSRFKGSSF